MKMKIWFHELLNNFVLVLDLDVVFRTYILVDRHGHLTVIQIPLIIDKVGEVWEEQTDGRNDGRADQHKATRGIMLLGVRGQRHYCYIQASVRGYQYET